jgi:LysM repeat protein
MMRFGMALGLMAIWCIDVFSQSKPLPNYPKSLPFLDTTANHFQSQQASLMGSILDVIGQPNNPDINILHIGDEQVSSLSNPLRKQLFYQGSQIGNAEIQTGLGLFFPGALNNNALDNGIKSSCTGLWTYATPIENNRLMPVGITGYSAKTEDWKSTITVLIPTENQNKVDQFKMFCERSEQNFDVVVSCLGDKKANGSPTILSKREFPASISYRNTPFLEMPIPLGTRSITIQFKQVISAQKSFSLHGISINNSRSLNFHSVGMRGCGYNEFNRLELFKQQLPLISPDLVILDFGQHENYRGNETEAAYLEPLKQSIKTIRDAMPASKIMVVIPQDCVRGGRTLQTFEKYQQAIIALCKTERIAYYDWYRVSGGKYSAQYWLDYALFLPDGLHLNEQGTDLKGQLYADAFRNTVQRYNNGYRQFIIAEDTSKRLAFRTRDTLSKNIVVSEVWRYHVVRRGETAYRIALRYGITVAQLKEWNHLRSYNIAAGTRLKVGKLSIATKSDPIQSLEMKDSADAETQDQRGIVSDSSSNKGKNPIPNISPSNGGKPNPEPSVVNNKPRSTPAKPVYHKVRNGETLYSIAKAYGLTVDQLKRMNGLRSNNIGVGRLLRVK